LWWEAAAVSYTVVPGSTVGIWRSSVVWLSSMMPLRGRGRGEKCACFRLEGSVDVSTRTSGVRLSQDDWPGPGLGFRETWQLGS
jgi:hypothetical protein